MKNLFVSPSMLRKGYLKEESIMMTRVNLNGPKNINVKELNKTIDKDGNGLYGIEFCKILAKKHNIDLRVEMKIMTKEAIRREFNI